METPKEWSEFADEMKQIFDTDLNSENESKKAKQAEFASQVNELKIPDPTAQLKADKEELLEALEEVKQFLNYIQSPVTPAIRLRMKIESIIKKHKS